MTFASDSNQLVDRRQFLQLTGGIVTGIVLAGLSTAAPLLASSGTITAITLTGSVGQGGKNGREDVTKIQALLDGVDPKKGGPNSKLIVDGLNGSKTVIAIKDFQQHQKLTSSGRIDPADATFNRLLSESSYIAATNIKSSVGENLSGGNQKQDVRKVQILLNAVPAGQGGPSTKLAVDGLIGAKTIEAIKKFQKHQALSPIDGRVAGPSTTLERLNELAQLTLTAHMALRILDTSGITLAVAHISNVNDDATVLQNIVDTADGRPVRLSKYDNAPGGTVTLLAPILNLILVIGKTYTYSITEIAGGSHSTGSRHYVGVAIDIGQLSGSIVSATNPDVKKVMQLCRDLGCTEVLGPGDPGHASHVHAALPRP